MTEPERQPEGVGCKPLLTVTGILLAFAVAAVTIGLSILLSDDVSGGLERIGFIAYASGAPVSGLFAALAGGLPLTLYLDVIVWMLVAFAVVRLVERGRSPRRLIGTVIGVAVVFGIVISSLVELA